MTETETPTHVKTKSLAKTSFLSLYESIYDVDGNLKSYIIVSRSPDYNPNQLKNEPVAVAIFATNKDEDKFLITEEFRYPANEWTISTPEGLIDDGEVPHVAAIRELEEETGYYKTLNCIELPSTYSSVGMTDERVIPFLMKIDDSLKKEVNLGEGELIQYRWVDKREGFQLATTAKNLTARAQFALLLFAKGVLF